MFTWLWNWRATTLHQKRVRSLPTPSLGDVLSSEALSLKYTGYLTK